MAKIHIDFYKKVKEFLEPFWKYIFIILGLMIIDLCLGLLAPYIFGKAADAILHNDGALTYKLIACACLVSIIQLQGLLFIRERIEIKHIDTDVNRHMAKKSMSKMLTFSVGQHMNENSGVKQHVVSKGHASLQETVFQFLYEIMPLTIRIVITSVVLFVLSPVVGLYVTGMVLTYIYVTYRTNVRLHQPIEKIRDLRQDNAKIGSEIYRNFPTAIIEAQEKRTLQDFDTHYKKVNDYEKSVWLTYNKTLLSNRFFITLGQYGGLLIGAYLILHGHFTSGIFITLYAWLQSLFGSLYQIGRLQRRLTSLLSDVRKYLEMMEIEPEIVNDANPVAMENLQGKIEFKNVSFAYPIRKSEGTNKEELPEGEVTISNVTFSINAGETVGIVGESGSGKTTVVNLFRRYHDPTDGTILVDGIDLKKIDLHSLRTQVGNVEQEVSLFDRTIRDNILYGLNGQAKDFTDKQVMEIAQMASIEKFISALPHGLNTIIGEKGVKLSGGERQRIAIARSLAKGPKILIFDEATSALDSNNEQIIHDAIEQSSRGRTTIIIAHRLSTVKNADKIIVMSKGKLVAQGTHKELLKTSPEYQDLVKKQVF